MNINSSRYYDNVNKFGKNTFLGKWQRKAWHSFHSKHENEFDEWREQLIANGSAKTPMEAHPIEYFFVKIPQKIETWLCCGFFWKYDKDMKKFTWFDNYHMVSKLSRYETWENVKITWWDKIRFKLITGYDFEGD